MSNETHRLVFDLVKDVNRGLLITSVRCPGQPFKNYIRYAKQPIHLHPAWLEDKIRRAYLNFTNHSEATIPVTMREFQCYFSSESFQFVFKGSVLKSQLDDNRKFLEAESRMKAAVEKRKKTRAANLEKLRTQDHEAENTKILAGLKDLFSTSKMD